MKQESLMGNSDHMHCWHFEKRENNLIKHVCCYEACEVGELVLNDMLTDHKEWHKLEVSQ